VRSRPGRDPFPLAFAMRLVAFVTSACVACGGESGPETARPVAFERWSPPQPTAYDIPVSARGEVVVLARRISRDAGSTWVDIPDELGPISRAEIVGTSILLHTSALGLVRWDSTTGVQDLVAGAPAFPNDRKWRVDPATGRFVVFDAVENAIALEGAAGWLVAELPRVSPTEVRPYIRDIEGNGATLLAASAWGVYRSRDGGATWQLVAPGPALAQAGRDLLVLADGRFVLVGGPISYVFAPDGEPAGTAPDLVVENLEATACEDGAIVARGRLTRDLGASWVAMIPPGDLQPAVSRASCARGRYWMLATSETWSYRLVRYDGSDMRGVVVGSWDAIADAAWATSGPAMARTADGTLLAAGLAWQPGEPWLLREVPGRMWASGGTLFGIARGRFVLSEDGGNTWESPASAGLDADELDAFARGPDGALYVGRMTGTRDETAAVLRSVVWKSDDRGASWTIAYEAEARRASDDAELTGEARRWLGIADDGTWIATDAVSADAGRTWQPTEVVAGSDVAFVSPRGRLVTTSPGLADDHWRVYEAGGRGELLATWAIEVEGAPVPASQLRAIAFDEAGHVYVARGSPRLQIWRTTAPIE
jgi:hypothetical protein